MNKQHLARSSRKPTAVIAVLCLVLALLPLGAFAPVAAADGDGLNVITVPWKNGQAHPVYNGKEVAVKAIARGGTAPYTFSWDFGDGSSDVTGSVTDPYNISARHTFPTSDPNTAFTATLTVTDAAGDTTSDIYKVVVKEKTLAVEVDVAIDEGLWYLHGIQQRYEMDGNPLGFWGWAPEFDEGYTGEIVEAFELHGHLPGGDADVDPYVETVERGLNYVLTRLSAITISAQPAGDPDSNGNGIGLLNDGYLGSIQMNSVSMLALTGNLDPTRTAGAGVPEVLGREYSDIARDMVDFLAWAQNETPSPLDGIHLYDIPSGSDTLLSHETNRFEFDAADDRIVWIDARGGWPSIYTYEISTGIETPVVTNTVSWPNKAAVSGDRVAWIDARHGGADIYMYDVATGVESPVSIGPDWKEWVAISGDSIVWTDFRHGFADIYIYDISTGEERRLFDYDGGEQYMPQISGSKIVWMDARNHWNNEYDFYMYDLSTDVETKLTNGDVVFDGQLAMSEDAIVWTGSPNGHRDIFGLDLDTKTQFVVADEPGNQDLPDIDDGHIVYQEYRGFRDSDVYLYEIATGGKTIVSPDVGAQLQPVVTGDSIIWRSTTEGMHDPNARGGWSWRANDTQSDNWSLNWSAIALMAGLERFGIAAPEWVGTELEIWLDFSQNRVLDEAGSPGPDYGAFGITSPTEWPHLQSTGSGLAALNYIGASTSDQRVIDALGYIERNWENELTGGWEDQWANLGNYDTMYILAGALRTTNPPITVVGEHDWYAEYARYLVDDQQADGYWGGRWFDSTWVTPRMLKVLIRTGENEAPEISADQLSVEADEGSQAQNHGTLTDPDGDPLALSVSVGTIVDNGDGTWSWSYEATDGPADGQTVTVVSEDDQGAQAQIDFEVVVRNIAPQVESITVPVVPVPVNSAVDVSADFSDAGVLDTHTATWAWGDGLSAGTVEEANGSGSVADTHIYSTPGVYTVTVTVTDKDGDAGSLSAEQYIVVYDPDGGFVTGGGWIDSPVGAYAGDPSATGKANFGFVSKYKHGANLPTGETEFQFKAGDLNFHSSTYEWLVVAGTKAQFKGEGTIDGGGDYGFMLSAVDGKQAGDADTFRLKIWEKASGDVIYDNKMGADDASDPDTELGGGNIVVHKD